VFDQPHVVEGLDAELAADSLAGRIRVVGGSFLESVPEGGDVYLLKHCLHNWDDAECVSILRASAQAMAPTPGARLLVIENVLPDTGAEDAEAILMLDLHMMAVQGGRERTRAEFEILFRDAGLDLTRLIATKPGAPDIVEGKRREP
jgi:hypothetical protein